MPPDFVFNDFVGALDLRYLQTLGLTTSTKISVSLRMKQCLKRCKLHVDDAVLLSVHTLMLFGHANSFFLFCVLYSNWFILALNSLQHTDDITSRLPTSGQMKWWDHKKQHVKSVIIISFNHVLYFSMCPDNISPLLDNPGIPFLHS